MDHPMPNCLLNLLQFGFIPLPFTISQLTSYLNDWIYAFTMTVQTGTMYMDYAKAFDAVCHEELLLKLEK